MHEARASASAAKSPFLSPARRAFRRVGLRDACEIAALWLYQSSTAKQEVYSVYVTQAFTLRHESTTHGETVNAKYRNVRSYQLPKVYPTLYLYRYTLLFVWVEQRFFSI